MVTTTTKSTPYSIEVAANVRAALARAGIRQTYIRASLGLSGASASARYNGITPWTVEELARVASILGVEVAELLPRQDSNLQPAGYPYRLVGALLVDVLARIVRVSR